jgi:hypothetical protein
MDGQTDGQLCRNQTGFPGVPVPDENAFPYGWFHRRNIKNDYVVERHVTDRREDQVNLYIRYVKQTIHNKLFVIIIISQRCGALVKTWLFLV